ncbi:PREDICTED: histone-lysine N-methyltransferase SETD1A-like [Tinamus guttatus]|uniref:histone-lysine N-methyltransferase SETD1A-like n=1 Tax=Tinamus guttatus TaxID=94827 RepID=UPI00052E7779|nr:PREDICTED: histone-lysine N-methyltransferase SETD1A-like [Tinamus guttatus]
MPPQSGPSPPRAPCSPQGHPPHLPPSLSPPSLPQFSPTHRGVWGPQGQGPARVVPGIPCAEGLGETPSRDALCSRGGFLPLEGGAWGVLGQPFLNVTQMCSALHRAREGPRGGRRNHVLSSLDMDQALPQITMHSQSWIPVSSGMCSFWELLQVVQALLTCRSQEWGPCFWSWEILTKIPCTPKNRALKYRQME